MKGINPKLKVAAIDAVLILASAIPKATDKATS